MVTYTSASNGTSAAVWYTWVEGTEATTSATASSGNTWRTWVAADTSATITTNSTSAAVWVAWTGSGSYTVRREYSYTPPQLTDEQIAEQKAEVEKRAKEKAEADARANKLLESHLTEEQLRQLRELDAFIVDLKSKQYRIRRGWSGNVDEIKDGMIVARHCIHPSIQVPCSDLMLAQKMLLETNEAEFLRIAKKTPLTPTPLAV